MNFSIHDKNNKVLFSGTRQDCRNFIKINRCKDCTIEKYVKVEIVEPLVVEFGPDDDYHTTAYVKPSQPGFLKKIFK